MGVSEVIDPDKIHMQATNCSSLHLLIENVSFCSGKCKPFFIASYFSLSNVDILRFLYRTLITYS